MRDERRIIVVEEDHKSSDGVAGVCGILFFVVMIFALVDRGQWRGQPCRHGSNEFRFVGGRE
ncbi:hypothetical protein [Phyllobacterium endophyticum]|uniref:hypothetical protein n=1 Tax=Phyllobacterium endophyticum TaxID=1149773 RepID=UPI0011C9A5D6|nr:hypothetical protein [Phyllobacterium endophyticum]TXR49506.1 hypothetical protein FVA77_09300 [Phyllobacterium endophyticum]